MIKTLGCKVNSYESEFIRTLFLNKGYTEVENGADVNKPNWHNFSPLSLAMLRKHSDIVALLLENGADTSYIVKGYTYAELAQQIGNQEIIKLIKQYQQ